MNRKRTWPFSVVDAGYLVTMLGTTLPTPLYPLYARRHGTSAVGLATIFATYALTVMVVRLGFGPRSDRFGRRRVLLLALLCRTGLDRMRADAQAALDELGPRSQWRPTAQLLEGICYLLAGETDRADRILATQPRRPRRGREVCRSWQLAVPDQTLIGRAPESSIPGDARCPPCKQDRQQPSRTPGRG